MKERVKSIILFILVLSSLILSTLLIFYSPNNANVSLSEYLPRLKFGHDSSFQKIIKPEEIIFHFGDNNHSIVRSNQKPYDKLVEEMEYWSFYDFTYVDNSIDWKDMIENKRGIEIVFPSSIPNSLLSSMFKVTTMDIDLGQISRIWIVKDSEDNVSTYLISDVNDKVFKSQTSISDHNLNQYISSANEEQKYDYHWSYPIEENDFVRSAYYLPQEGISMKIYNKTITPVSIGDFIQLLFIDPSIVKKVEMDNQEDILFTDGNRSMIYFPKHKFISFYQPISDNKKGIDFNIDLYSAIRYVNQHGGWDGKYYLDKAEVIQNGTYLQFRQYIDGYPISDYDGFYYGKIEMRLVDGIVSSFERSIILLEKYTDSKLTKTISNDELMNWLNKRKIKEKEVSLIELEYNIEEYEESIVLQPYWKISLIDGKIIEVPATESVVQ